MENYIGMLMLVVPGFIVYSIYKHFGSTQEVKSNFEITMLSLFYSVFVLFILWSAISLAGISQTDDIKEIFKTPKGVAIYSFFSLLVSCIVGGLFVCIKPKYNKLVNFFRKKAGQNNITLGGIVFEKVFNDGKPHLVEIYKEDKMLMRGLLAEMAYQQKELLIVENEEKLSPYMNDEGKPLKYKNVYMDYANNLIIKEINTE